MWKWKKRRKTAEDPAQGHFTEDMKIRCRESAKRKKTKLPNDLVICPFCLRPNELKKFLGKHKAVVECPNCKQGMLLRTVLTICDMTVEEFASWVYMYGRDFWFKIRDNRVGFTEWNKRLEGFGIAEEFWTEYKKRRGD